MSKYTSDAYKAGALALVVILIALCAAPARAPRRTFASTPTPAVETFTKSQFVAVLDVARVFGRSPGCAEADPNLIRKVADESIKSSMDPRILAATIAVESGCNQYATSTRGAIGLTQIVPKVWKGSYDFEHQYNLLNPEDNIHVGATILSGLVKQYGTTSGLHHYNGMGTDGDPGYADKITDLAARR